MTGTSTPQTKRCRWCRESFVPTTAWERRYALPVCLVCRMGDRVARKADGATMPIESTVVGDSDVGATVTLPKRR